MSQGTRSVSPEHHVDGAEWQAQLVGDFDREAGADALAVFDLAGVQGDRWPSGVT